MASKEEVKVAPKVPQKPPVVRRQSWSFSHSGDRAGNLIRNGSHVRTKGEEDDGWKGVAQNPFANGTGVEEDSAKEEVRPASQIGGQIKSRSPIYGCFQLGTDNLRRGRSVTATTTSTPPAHQVTACRRIAEEKPSQGTVVRLARRSAI